MFLYATTISIFYNYLHKKNPGRINKKLPNYCKLLNIDNINFPPAIKHIQQFEKDNPTISITIFEFGGIKKIDDDNNDDDDDNDDNNNNETTIIIMLLLILKNTMIVKQLLLILTLIKKKKKRNLKENIE